MAHACVAHEYIQTTELLDGLCDKILTSLGLGDVAWYCEETGLGGPGFDFVHIFAQGFQECVFLCTAEVTD